MERVLNKQDRKTLDAILDALIPANPHKGIPAAGAFGVGDFVERQMAEDPSIAVPVTALIRLATQTAHPMPVERVRGLESDMPKAFQLLLRLTYMAYYSRSEIRELLGVAPWPVHPKGYDVPTEAGDLMDALTAPVRARGKVYRATPGAESA